MYISSIVCPKASILEDLLVCIKTQNEKITVKLILEMLLLHVIIVVPLLQSSMVHQKGHEYTFVDMT